MLVQGEYARQGRQARGVVRAYVRKMTGKSMPRITRLIRQYRQTGEVRAVAYRRRRFAQVYTEADVLQSPELPALVWPGLRPHRRRAGSSV